MQGAGLAHPLLAGLAHRHHTRMHLTLGGVAAGGAAVGGKAASEAAVEERVPRLLLEVLPPSAALLLPLSLLLRLLLRVSILWKKAREGGGGEEGEKASGQIGPGWGGKDERKGASGAVRLARFQRACPRPCTHGGGGGGQPGVRVGTRGVREGCAKAWWGRRSQEGRKGKSCMRVGAVNGEQKASRRITSSFLLPLSNFLSFIQHTHTHHQCISSYLLSAPRVSPHPSSVSMQ